MGQVHYFPVAKKLTPQEAQAQMRTLIKAVRENVCGGCKKRFAEFYKINFPEKPNLMERTPRWKVEMWLRANMPNHSLPVFPPSTV